MAAAEGAADNFVGALREMVLSCSNNKVTSRGVGVTPDFHRRAVANLRHEMVFDEVVAGWLMSRRLVGSYIDVERGKFGIVD